MLVPKKVSSMRLRPLPTWVGSFLNNRIMRYNSIANRQLIISCLFLFFLIPACRSVDQNRKMVRVASRAVLIEYAGDPTFDQGDLIQINGRLFWHDSLYVFHKKSTDTVYLPTQRYIADQPPGGRPVYSFSNALSTLMQITDALVYLSDSTIIGVDATRLPAGKLIVRAKGKGPVEVIATTDYPLRITPLKD